jgi:hypothetical protein
MTAEQATGSLAVIPGGDDVEAGSAGRDARSGVKCVNSDIRANSRRDSPSNREISA